MKSDDRFRLIIIEICSVSFDLLYIHHAYPLFTIINVLYRLINTKFYKTNSLQTFCNHICRPSYICLYIMLCILPKIQTVLFWNKHLISGFDVKRIVPRVNMWQSTVYAPTSKRMRVTLGTVSDFLRSYICSPDTCICKEETLFWSKTVNCR